MATATTGAGVTVDADRPPPLPLDSIPTIDLSLLSQSELLSLSMCSNSSFDFNRCDDVVIPKIDRSVFNESAGSRKQTYSRLRLAPAESSTSTNATIHRHTPGLRSLHAPISNNINDPGQAENSQIIRILKELFKPDHSFEESVPIEVEIDTNVVVPELSNHDMNKKRGHEDADFIHPPAAKKMRNNTVKKVVSYDEDRDREIMNCKGEKINVENLGTLEDPYGLEIRRRTEGMSTEDDLLGFLRGLNGKWESSRKKKRVVDASDFGDALPKGWKLSLCIKKKEGRALLFCHHYISPSGRQFESCTEISTYLLLVIGEANVDHTQSKDCDDIASKGASGKALDLFVQKDRKRNTHVVLALPCSLSNQVKPKAPNVKRTSGKAKELFVRKDLKRNTLALPSSFPEQVKSETLTVEKTSEAPTIENTVDPVLYTEVPESDQKISSCTETKTDNLVHDLKILDHVNINEDVLLEESGEKIVKNCTLLDANEFPEREKALDVSVSNLNNETDKKFEISVETIDFVEEKSECILEQGTSVIKESLHEKECLNEETQTQMNIEKSHIEKSECNLEQSTSVIKESLHEKECLNEEPQTQMNTENSHIENDFQDFRNDESIKNEVALLGSSQNGLNLEFDFQDDIFGNKIYSPPLKFDGIHELSFSFGNSDGLFEDTFSVEEKKDGVDCLVVPSKIEETFEVKVNNETHNGNVLYEGGTWEDSRAFTYDTGMEQGFDSSFWSGRNGGMVSSVCPWCGNEFQFQSSMGIDPATQDAIGSLCPTCSAGISGQVNML